MITPRPGLPRTGYLILSPFGQKLPMLYSKLIQTSPEGPTSILATGGSGAPRTMMPEKVSDPAASYGELPSSTFRSRSPPGC